MSDTVHMSLDEVRALSTEVLIANGMSEANAIVIADVVTQAEADGTHSHGLFRVPGYVTSMRSGRMNGKAVPEVTEKSPGLVAVDSKNGFSPPAIIARKPLAIEKAKSQGIAALGLRNNGNLNALWWEAEHFGDAGLICLTMSTSQSFVAPWGGNKALFGTDPIAFACPRARKAADGFRLRNERVRAGRNPGWPRAGSIPFRKAGRSTRTAMIRRTLSPLLKGCSCPLVGIKATRS